MLAKLRSLRLRGIQSGGTEKRPSCFPQMTSTKICDGPTLVLQAHTVHHQKVYVMKMTAGSTAIASMCMRSFAASQKESEVSAGASQVFQVRKLDSGRVYAMKVMRKERILERDHGDYVRAERDVLTAVFHPYIVTLRFSFQARRGGALPFFPFWKKLTPTCLDPALDVMKSFPLGKRSRPHAWTQLWMW